MSNGRATGDILLGLLGAAALLLAIFDALETTLGTGGAGPVSGAISRGVWAAAVALHRKRPSHRMLSRTGPALLVTVVATWILLLWLGYFCLFSIAPQDIVHAQTQQPAEAIARLYFTGFTIFTLGIGDIIPSNGFYQILTAVASANGLVLITLSITYLIPVLSAATSKRQLAALIHNLGGTPQKILLQAWDGRGFEGLCNSLGRLEPMIEQHAQRHLAYPVLHYFHSSRSREALGRQIAVLDEALLLLQHGVSGDASPPPACVAPVRRCIGGFLEIVGEHFVNPSESDPPVPSLEPLRQAGLPVSKAEQVTEAARDSQKRRRLLQAFVQDQGWFWGDVFGENEKEFPPNSE